MALPKQQLLAAIDESSTDSNPATHAPSMGKLAMIMHHLETPPCVRVHSTGEEAIEETQGWSSCFCLHVTSRFPHCQKFFHGFFSAKIRFSVLRVTDFDNEAVAKRYRGCPTALFAHFHVRTGRLGWPTHQHTAGLELPPGWLPGCTLCKFCRTLAIWPWADDKKCWYILTLKEKETKQEGKWKRIKEEATDEREGGSGYGIDDPGKTRREFWKKE